MRRVIVISGTPGTGKTSVARILAHRLRGVHLELSRIVEEERLWTDRDETRGGTLIVDAGRLVEYLKHRIPRIGGTVIIDTHYSELLPPELVDAVFVLRLNPCLLWKRLEARGWPKEKIRENVEAEIVGVCSAEARSAFREKVCDVDVSGMSAEEVAEKILLILNNGECEAVDWIDLLGPEVLDVLVQGSSCTPFRVQS